MKKKVFLKAKKREISIYVHIPFCISKCSYCDFNSLEIEGCKGYVNEYVLSLLEEISLIKEKMGKASFVVPSVFFGGGTPTVLAENEISKVLVKIKRCFNLKTDCEITIEANPETLTQKKLFGLKESGVNRISLGVQSFDDTLLKKIGRVHSSLKIYESCSLIKDLGFENFSLDLMYGLPGQNMNSWKKSLLEAIKLTPSHISAYCLTLSPGTKLYDQHKSKEISLPNELVQVNMYKEAVKVLHKNGFIHYEISNFSKPDYSCIHNMQYWENKEYIGLGVSAHSFISGERKWNYEKLADYILRVKEGQAYSGSERLSLKDQINEHIMLGLRLVNGFSINNFNKRFQVDFKLQFKEVLKDLKSKKLINFKGENIFLTADGLCFHDGISAMFF